MLADFEYTFSRHDETIRRAESNYALIKESTTKTRDTTQRPPRGKLLELLRRLAGPAAA
jgi:hypothetical protein